MVRVGLGLEAACDHFAAIASGGAGLTDFVEYGVHVSQGVPAWVRGLREDIGPGFNLHPLDVNLAGDEREGDGWCEALAVMTRELRATALVSDVGFWYHGHRGSIWERPAAMPGAAVTCRKNAARVAEACSIPFRIENPPLEWMPGKPSLWTFLERASDHERVEICLDLSHLLQFERNVHGRAPALPRAFPWEKVTEVHLAGFVVVEYEGVVHYVDQHMADIPREEYRLLIELLELRGGAGPLEICLEMEPRGVGAYEAAAVHLRSMLPGL